MYFWKIFLKAMFKSVYSFKREVCMKKNHNTVNVVNRKDMSCSGKKLSNKWT